MPWAEPRPWIVPVEGGLRLTVRVQPGARRSEIGGPTSLAGGRAALKVRVTAAPEGGKANAALIALLSKAWRLPKGAFEILSGRGARTKTVKIAGDPAALEARLAHWLRDQGACEGR
ncbi:MAG: DUF167 domain-containing protein [Kiloniellales bacterium]|nr:DUF167 domain-containing protein [Kiloniellales bacterium]